MITGGLFFKRTHVFSAWTVFVILVGLLQATKWKTQLYIELSCNLVLNKHESLTRFNFLLVYQHPAYIHANITTIHEYKPSVRNVTSSGALFGPILQELGL